MFHAILLLFLLPARLSLVLGHEVIGYPSQRWTRKCHGFQQTYSLSDLSNLDPTTRVAKLQDSCSSEPPLDLLFSGSVAKPQYMGTYKWIGYNYYGKPVYQKGGYYLFFYDTHNGASYWTINTRRCFERDTISCSYYAPRDNLQGQLVKWSSNGAFWVTLGELDSVVLLFNVQYTVNDPTNSYPSWASENSKWTVEKIAVHQCVCDNGVPSVRTNCPSNGASRCQSCQVGYVLSVDTTACVCMQGTFRTNSVCVQCQAGKFQNKPGQAQCLQCGTGKISVAGSSECNISPETLLHVEQLYNKSTDVIANLTARTLLLEEDIRNSTRENKELATQRDNLIEINTTLTAERDTLARDKKRLTGARDRLQEDMNDLTATNASLTMQRDELIAERDQLNNTNEALTGRGATLEKDKERLIEEKAQLENEKAQLIIWNSTLTGRVSVLTATKDAVLGENNEYLSRIEKLIEWNSTLIATNNALSGKNNELLLGKEELRRELVYSQLNFSALTMVLKTTVNELEQIKKESALEKSSGGDEDRGGGDKKNAGESSKSTVPTDDDDDDDDDAALVSQSHSAPSPAVVPAPASTSSTSSTSSTINTVAELEQCNQKLAGTVARYGEMLMVLSGLLFFCLALLTIFCCRCLTRKKTPAPPPVIIIPKHVGKFGQFMDRNHDAIKKIGHHDHAVSVQKISRVHSRRKVEKIQKNQFHAKGRLMARLKQRAEASQAVIEEAQKIAGTGSTDSSRTAEQKKMDKKLEKQKRKEEKRAQKRASKVAAKGEKKKRKKSLKKKEDVEEDMMVVRVEVAEHNGKANPHMVALLRTAMATMMKKSNNFDRMIAKSDPQGRGVLSLQKFVTLAGKIGTRMDVMPGSEVFKEAWWSAKTKSKCPAGEIEHEILREWLGIGIDVVVRVEEESMVPKRLVTEI